MAAVVCAIATLGHVAEAATFRTYVFIRTNSGYTSGGIDIDGPIKPGDDLRFRTALNDARRHLNQVANVRLNSLGGDMRAAMEIADIVARNRLDARCTPTRPVPSTPCMLPAKNTRVHADAHWRRHPAASHGWISMI
jgi:hypothetical protein